VHILSLRSSKPTIRRTALWDIPVNTSETFAGPMVVFLTAYQFSYTLDILFRSDSRRPSATGLLREIEFVVSILLRRSLTELTAQFL